ncbi:undecaprenyl-diphosphate phosphatase [Ramlibacter tataouinensis]|uniref:Undecaprenyl-diphosphatase n=1 Tax=Ramlibacter tataouinensis (strain ATCC BAA-407 / DSM 14655 / LMG 21543 / TTB310) TaxID=365046 RepID=F5Y2N8_RAMTT|nr:undecaprenyl-diphosphate phosphatase [Ramlibacter tataouinensis]AEG92401.1 Candidate bacitracin resistance protein [Ramlibacter tataouinensis TTB310]
MTWIEAVVLGALQGLTEFLPISSSAHLRIVGPLLPSGSDPGAAFTAIVQIGSEAAVLLYFRHDLLRIARAWATSLRGGADHDRDAARLGWLILVGTLPIGVAGLALRDAIEGAMRHLLLTAATLILFGLLLGLADRLGRKSLTLQELRWRHGLVFGLAQALALVPGVSRSGGTITAGLLMGFTRETAARYSFLLAVPAVLASGLFQLLRHGTDATAVPPGPTALAALVAFGVGYAVIVGFLRVVAARSFMPFVVYRVLLGLLLVVLLGTGRLHPL